MDVEVSNLWWLGKRSLYITTTHLLSIERADWPNLRDTFKARDANLWQHEFPLVFPVEVSALNSISINIFMTLMLILKADAWLKQNMSYWPINSLDFALKKTALTLKRSCNFFRVKSNELKDQQDMFSYIPGACATHNFTYLARGPCVYLLCSTV